MKPMLERTNPAGLHQPPGYVVSADRADLSEVWRILGESPIAGALESASTLLGVSQPGYPGQLVEIDVTAALSGSGPA